jgi:hypothetical protein
MLEKMIARFAHRRRQLAATDPSQRSLDAMTHRVTRVRVLNGGVSGGRAIGKEVLLDVTDPGSIATLRECLAIVEDSSTFGHCMCLGDYAMQLYAGRRRIAMIGLHHGRSIRWDAWRYDALLQDGRRLLTWLADRGATAPLEAYEEDQRRAEENRQAAIRWQQAMPACLHPYWDQMLASAGNMATFIPVPQGGEGHQGQAEASSGLTPLLGALETEYPDPERRVLALFEWYGSGKGPWSGFPSYEGTAEALLLEFPTSQLVTTLVRQPLAPMHLEGAARYFAGYYFNTQKPDERDQIPQELKQRLLTHSLESSDEDKIGRAKRAFAA